jgi:hypothetical protein
MAGIVAGVGLVAGMSFSGATPGTSTTVESFIGGLPSVIAQLNLGVVALLADRPARALRALRAGR